MVGSESELNSLSSCFQSVVQDLKTSNSSLELVCNRAVKLANQLTATMNCLAGFSDAIQVIGDSGKWSSRDIGTSLTRFCLRQRALETEIKTLASSLIEGFAAPLEKNGAQWKHRLSEIEKRHQKNLKKTRSKKQTLAGDLISEHKAGCSEILLEQRTQFNTFASLLLPVINAQLRLFEEGIHVKSVKETIEQSIEAKNNQAIVNTVIEDVCHSGDSSWRKRLTSPTRSNQMAGKPKTGCNDSNSSPSTSSMALSWNQGDTNSLYYGTVSSVGSSRPQTLSSSTDFGKQRAAISSQTFVPPTGTPFVLNSPTEFAKPPLPRRDHCGNGVKTPGQSSLSNNMSISSNNINGAHLNQRPLSFNEEAHQKETKQDETHSLSEQISNLVDKLNDDIHMMCDQSLTGPDSCPTTVRRLGSEPVGIPASISLTQRLSVDSIRSRPPFAPLPPERRNSTITAATTNAPSIFDLRNAGVFSNQSLMNGRVQSIQDLNQMPTHYGDETYSNGVVYRSAFSQSAGAPNYVSQPPYNSETLPEPPMNAERPGSYTSGSYRPPAF
ncbi:IMD domain-containing protein [Aphelenchoides bicaudatus]|nr:IMD domain-containing protein [Aphelenchoides bicaudatus]